MKINNEKENCECSQCTPKEEIYPETKQKLIRPEICWKRVILFSVLAFFIDGVLAFGAIKLFSFADILISISAGLQFAIMYVFFLICTLMLFAKQIIIFTIRLYQKYAPYDIRSNCLFVPNCSEYMILAIQKYGLFKGIKKGVDRFNRCHAPNGGIDYP